MATTKTFSNFNTNLGNYNIDFQAKNINISKLAIFFSGVSMLAETNLSVLKSRNGLIGIIFIYFCNIVKLFFKDALKVFMTFFGIDRGSIYVLH